MRGTDSDYARRLSKMTNEDRLLVRAIYRSRRRPKAGFQGCGKLSMGSSNLCPKEWR